MNKLNLFIIGMIACALTTSSALIYIQRPANAFKAKVQPYPILTPVVAIGAEIKWHVNSCHINNLSFESTRQLKNVDTGKIIDIPEHNTQSQTPVGKCMEADRTFVLPIAAEPGRYELIFDVQTTVNPWNTTQAFYKTDIFIIK